MIIWDVKTSRKLFKKKFEGIIYFLEWSKAGDKGILAICNEKELILMNPKV